ncbi:MAG: ribonuclease J [Eubacteriales bacterium]|nr:ribonuclease J [Eubacteriales bacterium]
MKDDKETISRNRRNMTVNENNKDPRSELADKSKQTGFKNRRRIPRQKNVIKDSKPEVKQESEIKRQKPRRVNTRNKLKEDKNVEPVKIIPLGGLEQIGMNITAFEYKDSIVVVDCGMAFPDDDMLGIDLVIPDVTYLKKNAAKVKGFFITHGHEDHIGALPYILRDLNVPVYSTKLTIALIENKLREAELLDLTTCVVVQHGDVIPAGDFNIEFIKTNHSIQDASAIAIHSPAGVLLHTGDFKVDYTPVFGDAIDLQRFAELGKQGVLALMADSTNALRGGFTMSERTVGRTFDAIFAEHPNNRIIIATFASNVDRVQQVINDAEKYGRKVVVEGRSMVNVIGTAVELGYIKINEGTLIDIAHIRDYPAEKTVLVTTGSQGESMAALSRMASGQHKKVTIGADDVIVLSSTPIPGNEKAVAKVINELSQKHAKVIYQDTHVSGHACQEELKLIYSLVHPKFAIPLHGEYRHRIAQRDIAVSVGVPMENVLIAESGDVISVSNEGCSVVDKVQAGPLLVDGLGIGDVGNIVLRDRQNLAQNGIIVVVLALEKYSGQLLSGPDIVSRGFVYVRENEALMEEARLVVMDAVDDCLVHHVSDWSRIKSVIRDSLSEFLWRRMKRNPVILPIISEV